jgi:hypothetical protein
MAARDVEDGIRAYLELVGTKQRPKVDRDAVNALEARIRATGDHLEKLRLVAELIEERKGKDPAEGKEQALFIAHAKEWAAKENIPVAAFQKLKVPDEVLRQAGFTVRSAKQSAAGPAKSGGRGPRIDPDEVRSAIADLAGAWKLTDLAEKVGREPSALRGHLRRLIKDGVVIDLGDDPDHTTRGKAPRLYQSA